MATPSFKRCFAVGCETTVPRKFLMCGPHWDKVPTDLQHEVYRSFHAWNAGKHGVSDVSVYTIRKAAGIKRSKTTKRPAERPAKPHATKAAKSSQAVKVSPAAETFASPAQNVVIEISGGMADYIWQCLPLTTKAALLRAALILHEGPLEARR